MLRNSTSSCYLACSVDSGNLFAAGVGFLPHGEPDKFYKHVLEHKALPLQDNVPIHVPMLEDVGVDHHNVEDEEADPLLALLNEEVDMESVQSAQTDEIDIGGEVDLPAQPAAVPGGSVTAHGLDAETFKDMGFPWGLSHLHLRLVFRLHGKQAVRIIG